MSGLSEDWRRLNERIEDLTAEIEALIDEDENCRRLMTVPGVGPIIASAMVPAIGIGARRFFRVDLVPLRLKAFQQRQPNDGFHWTVEHAERRHWIHRLACC
jgi:hypothetical protein